MEWCQINKWNMWTINLRNYGKLQKDKRIYRKKILNVTSEANAKMIGTQNWCLYVVATWLPMERILVFLYNWGLCAGETETLHLTWHMTLVKILNILNPPYPTYKTTVILGCCKDRYDTCKRLKQWLTEGSA